MKHLTIQRNVQRKLYWLLPDDLLFPPKPIPEEVGFPQIVQYSPQRTIPFTKELQNFIFNLNRSDDEERDRQAFQGYRDTWNTTGKIHDHYNAITDDGDPNDLPTYELNIGAGANVVSGTRELSSGVAETGIPKNTIILRLETLSLADLDGHYTYQTHPWLIHHLATIIPTVLDGIHRRNPFPQMGGRSIPPYLPSYTALISPTPLFIEMNKVSEVTTIPNPYWPPWNWLTHTSNLEALVIENNSTAILPSYHP